MTLEFGALAKEFSKPVGFESDLGDFAVLVRDKTCSHPVVWGFHILHPLEPARFEELMKTEKVICLEKGKWAWAAKIMSAAEAIEHFGRVTDEEFGPRGGWKSTTYGTETFSSRYMKR